MWLAQSVNIYIFCIYCPDLIGIFYFSQHGEYAVKTHHLEYGEGGILDMDDMLSDLVEDRDRVRMQEEHFLYTHLISAKFSFFFLFHNFQHCAPISVQVWQIRASMRLYFSHSRKERAFKPSQKYRMWVNLLFNRAGLES